MSVRAVLAPVRLPIASACVLQAVSSLAGLAPFVAVAEIGRELLTAEAGDGLADSDQVWRWVWIAVVALAVRLATFLAAGAITHLTDLRYALDLRRTIATHLGRLPLGYFSEVSSGRVKKLVQDDVGQLHHLVAHAAVEVTAGIVTPLAALVYLVTVDWRMTLVALVPLVLVIVTYAVMMRGAAGQMAEYDRRIAQLDSVIVEFVQGIAVVKTFGQSRRAYRRFAEAADGYADWFSSYVAKIARVGAASEIVASPLPAVVVILAGGTAFVSAGSLAPADLLPFLLVGVQFTAPVTQLGYAFEDLRRSVDAAGRIAALLDEPTLQRSDTPRSPVGTRVRFDEVSFSYDGEHPAVDGVTLTLEPGTVTALVGPSGSGKSTIARLLPRFSDVDAGSVSIGGVDVRAMEPAELYAQVSFVFQDVHLLRTTVRDNIRLGRRDAGQDVVEAAARAAQIHERILELPRGYDSVVGEDAHLSGGEAQRVSIARALVVDAPILVLDEATAFADPESESAIQEALSHLIAGRTLLVVAHRLHTITGADQVVVLDRGRVVETGRHDDLVGRGGRYARLWEAHERAGRIAVRGTTATGVRS